MDTELNSLCSDVDQLVALLRAHNLPGWSDALEKGATEIRKSDFHGVVRILHCYGGMGTLNDIILHGEDDDLFQALKTRIYEKSDAIRRHEEIVARSGFSPLDQIAYYERGFCPSTCALRLGYASAFYGLLEAFSPTLPMHQRVFSL